MQDAPFVTRVGSRTNPNRGYQVRVYGPERATCDCFKFRRYTDCHHLQPAIVQYLHWRARQQDSSVPSGWHPILSGADQRRFEREHAQGSAGHAHCWACRLRESV
jgi:hypothetical protein